MWLLVGHKTTRSAGDLLPGEGGDNMQVVLNTKISLELRQQLDQHSKDTNKAMAKIVAEALEAYFKALK